MNEQIIKGQLEGHHHDKLPKAMIKLSLRPAFTGLVREQRTILALSLPLVTLVVICSTIGLLNPGIYEFAPQGWARQTAVQCAFNLFVVTPVLSVAALYSFQGVKLALLMWGGTVAYLAYTFLIYCFNVPLNTLFLPYFLMQGLSIYSLCWFIVTQIQVPVVTKLRAAAFRKVVGTYFIAISVVLYLMWLIDITPASFANPEVKTPALIGFIANPIHVVDLSFFLPIVFIIGLMAIYSIPFAAVLIPVALIFFILTDLMVAAVMIVMTQNGQNQGLTASVMCALALFSLFLLIIYVTKTKEDLTN